MEALVILLIAALVLCGAPLYVIFGALSVWLFAQLPDTPVSQLHAWLPDEWMKTQSPTPV